MATHRFEYKPPGSPPLHGFPDPPRRSRPWRRFVPSKRLKAAHRVASRVGERVGLKAYAGWWLGGTDAISDVAFAWLENKSGPAEAT